MASGLAAHRHTNGEVPCALRAEQAFTISLSVRNEHAAEVNFRCRMEERVIVEGQLEVAWEQK